MHILLLISVLALAQGRAHNNHHHQQSHGHGNGHAYGHTYGHGTGHQTNFHPNIVLGPAPYIVGGKPTTRSEHPYIVSLERSRTGHFCGGSLIATNLVLTAAHCYQTGRINVVAADNRDSNSDAPKVSGVTRDQWIMHPDYNSITLENDIAIIKLHGHITTQDDYVVKPATLPNANDHVKEGTMCSATGWGATAEGSNTLPAELQTVEKPIFNHDSCNNEYGGGVADTMVCAGYPEGGRDSCQGDSGGPLTCNEKLEGIVSWGVGCARPGFPGVYTRVASFIDWINPLIRRYSS